MKYKSKNKAEVKNKSRFAFRVSFHQWDEVKVERFQITASTDTHVTYINEYGVEFSIEKRAGSYQWFKSKERADALAIKKLQERIDFYSDTVKRLERQMKKISKST